MKDFFREAGAFLFAGVLVMVVCNCLVYAVIVDMDNRDKSSIEAQSLAAEVEVRP